VILPERESMVPKVKGPCPETGLNTPYEDAAWLSHDCRDDRGEREREDVEAERGHHNVSE
jgi:hypothetical protein